MYRAALSNALGDFRIDISPANDDGVVRPLSIIRDGVKIEWNGDKDDPLKPVLMSGASISILTDDFLWDVAGSTIDDCAEVTIYQTVDETTSVVWHGRVSPCLYDQPWRVKRREFTIECVDDLSLLKWLDFETVNVNGLTTIPEYFEAALDAVNQSLVLDSEEIFEDVSLDEIAVMEANWYDESGNPSKWDEVLEHIARALKIRIVQKGMTVYLRDVESVADTCTELDDIDFQAAPRISLADTYNRVTVTVNVNGEDNIMQDIFDEKNLTYLSRGEMIEERIEDKKAVYYDTPYVLVENSEHAPTKVYTCVGDLFHGYTLVDATGGSWDNREGAWLAMIGESFQIDRPRSLGTNLLIGGNVSLDQVIVMSQCDNMAQLDSNNKPTIDDPHSADASNAPMITLKDHTKRVYAGDKTLVLSASVRFVEYFLPVWNHNFESANTSSKVNQIDFGFKCRLRIGDKYYTGANPNNILGRPDFSVQLWTTTPTDFMVYISPDNSERWHADPYKRSEVLATDLIIHNDISWKTGIGVKGKAIYIRPDDEVSGDLELTIYMPMSPWSTVHKTYALFKNLRLSVETAKDWGEEAVKDFGDDDIEYTNVINEDNVKDFDEITLYVHTDVDNGFARSALLKVGSGSLEYLKEVTNALNGETGVIERHLVDALYRQYRIARKVISGTAIERLLDPAEGVQCGEFEARFLPTNITWHLDDGRSELVAVECDNEYPNEEE